MSDPHRPFGVPPDDHDLEREPRTDAPSDADALDAWLNEIAHVSGLPGTRSGNGQHRPNARIDDHDASGADSLIETAARFHKRVGEAQAGRLPSASPDPKLWETIMERTSTPAAAATASNPWNARRTTRTPASTSTPKTRQRAIRQQRVWNMAANFGLVAAILLALFGTWRLAGTPGMPGGDDDGQPVSHMAMQPASPGSTPTPAVTAPAAGTPAPATACDLSEDIPFFNGIDESPWDGPAVLLTTSSEVVLTCPEDPEGTVLAEIKGQGAVSPMHWPGTVLVQDYDDSGKAGHNLTSVVNLITGDVVEFDSARAETMQGTSSSPWVVGPAPDDPSDLQILDLRTMNAQLLSDFVGGALPEHGGYLLSSSSDTLVLALVKQEHAGEGEATLITEGLPGDLLALDGSFDAARWISAPQDFPPVVTFEVSPDGASVALHGARGPYKDRAHSFSIMGLSDGEEITRSEPFGGGPAFPEAVWVQGGGAIAYIADGTELTVLPVNPDGTEQVVFRGEGQIAGLQATSNDSIVLIDLEWRGEPGMATPDERTRTLRARTLVAVDIGTSEATTLTGIDVSDNVGWSTPPDRFLVTFEPQANQGDTVTYQVIDATTGETIGTLDDVPLTETGSVGYPSLGLHSVVSSVDGETEIIAFDTQHIYLMQVKDGEPEVRRITSPPGIADSMPAMASMFLSDHGTLLSLSAANDESQTRWLLPINGEPDGWVELPTMVPSQGATPILFVAGTGD